MRQYETMIILPPNLGESELEQAVAGVETDLRERFGGQNVTVDRWGKKTLAYPIRKFADGYYVLYEYESDVADLVTQLQNRLRINESVMRFLTIRRDEELRTESRIKERQVKRRRFHPDDHDDDGNRNDRRDD